jgi:hypothetical protein
MQFLVIPKSTTLSSLADRIGERNIDDLLNVNSLARTVNIGKQFYDRAKSVSGEVDAQTKINLLNTFVGASDIYEKAALGSDVDWWLLANYGCFSDALRIPDNITLPPATDVLGNSENIAKGIYEKCVYSLTETGVVDPSIFSENISAGGNLYGIINTSNASRSSNGRLTGNIYDTNSQQRISPFQNFKFPWGLITLYSSISDTFVEIPAYPEEGISWGTDGNYTQMPDMLYQYEPWQVYQSSGPNKIDFTFHLHRDMWTGDHTDGNAARLIRFCEANCYPDYNGASVIAPKVSMYINGSNIITGVMTSTHTDWSGPIGSDGFYLEFKLNFSITEISNVPLNYRSVMKKGLIE